MRLWSPTCARPLCSHQLTVLPTHHSSYRLIKSSVGTPAEGEPRENIKVHNSPCCVSVTDSDMTQNNMWINGKRRIGIWRNKAPAGGPTGQGTLHFCSLLKTASFWFWLDSGSQPLSSRTRHSHNQGAMVSHSLESLVAFSGSCSSTGGTPRVLQLKMTEFDSPHGASSESPDQPARVAYSKMSLSGCRRQTKLVRNNITFKLWFVYGRLS